MSLKVEMVGLPEKFSGNETTQVEKMGKVILQETLKSEVKRKNFCEALGLTEDELLSELKTTKQALLEARSKKEDLTFDNNTVFYTTAVAGFIEKRLRPKLVSAGVIKSISISPQGISGIKIPLRSALITAIDYPDAGTLTNDTGTYGGDTITTKWIQASNALTFEMIQGAAVELMAAELGEIGDALARKMDTDIIAAIDAACTTGNANLTYLGATTDISYDAIVDGFVAAAGNYAEPDTILTNPTTYGQILKFDELLVAMAYSSTSQAGLNQPGRLLNMNIVWSPQVGAKNLYLIDSQRTGYLVRTSDVVVFDGRITGSTKFEVIGLMGYGVGIVQPKSIYKIKTLTAAP